jgi:hypothetical protein
VAIILRAGKTPDGAEVVLMLRHVIGRIRAGWPTVDIVVRGDSHYGRPEAMAWCERQRIGYVFGLAGNPVLLQPARRGRRPRSDGEGEKVHRWGDFPMPQKAGPSSAASSLASRPALSVPIAASSSPIYRAYPRRYTRRSIAGAARPRT